MARKPAPKKGINLLEEISAPKTFWEKFYYWALSIGRFIVIGTEAIVMIVFIARFKLDRDINDINDSLEVKAAILASMEESEAEARRIQDRMILVREVYETKEDRADIYYALISLKPEGSTIHTFGINDDRLTITATSNSLAEFNDFENSFKESGLLQEVTIPITETEEEGGSVRYNFTLRAKVKLSEE